jgi:ABC-type branched-subunit amino acid transport system substrate-binding protein
VSATLALAAVAGCGGGSTARAAATIQTGTGVTADTITLGVLTDLTGPFAALGTAVTTAAQLYVDQTNTAGGICGRKVDLLVRDHGYDVDKAVSLYREMEPKVLGFEQLLGSPTTSALLANIESDEVMTSPASGSSTLLKNPYISLIGTTYDVEAINAVDYLVTAKTLRPGDAVGHLRLDNEYGANALLGSTYAAQRAGLTVVDVPVAARTTDLGGAVATLRTAGVKAVVVSLSPGQTAAALVAATDAGLTVPFVGNNPSYSPALLTTPAGTALTAHFLLVASSAPPSADLPALRTLSAAYTAMFPHGTLDSQVVYGYGVATTWGVALRTACASLRSRRRTSVLT